MNDQFVNEFECYRFLGHDHIFMAPSYQMIFCLSKLNSLNFHNKQDVVYKGVAQHVWHKSDQDLIAFEEYSEENITKNFEVFRSKVPENDWQGLLVVDKVQKTKTDLPSEIFISFKDDPHTGLILTMGIGGIHTELWGQELKKSVVNIPLDLFDLNQALQMLQKSFLGKILSGNVRLGKPLISEEKLLEFLEQLFSLKDRIKQEGFSLLEFNPVVITPEQKFIALDGVGMKQEKTKETKAAQAFHLPSLTNPKTVGIIGVSSKKKSFGTIIYDNLLESKIAEQDIFVIKDCPSSEFPHSSHVANLDQLSQPLDMLIVATPAQTSYEIVKEVFEKQSAKVIYMIAGGIGDSADEHGTLKNQFQQLIETHKHDKLCPKIIGPNSLGIVNAPLKLSTLFIEKQKLSFPFHENGSIAFIAQSGAFFITRVSRNPGLPIKYGFCIGNQIDLSATDILKSVAQDPEIKTIALYLEGPPGGDSLGLAKAIKEQTALNKHVIVYRAGISPEGAKAAAGHTGSLASDFVIEKVILESSGAIVTNQFSFFENLLTWYGCYPDYQQKMRPNIGVITNAGYEAVTCADHKGERLVSLSADDKQILFHTLNTHGLSQVVSPDNPLDLTPMANEQVYLDTAKCYLELPQTDALVLGIVPLTSMLDTTNPNQKFSELNKLIKLYSKPICIVVDSGPTYDTYRNHFRSMKLPVFSSTQEALACL